jgi:hypothetical protein
MLLRLALGLGERRRKVTSFLLVLEPCGLMGTIAKGFAGGVPATAKRYGLPPAKAEWLAFHIDEFDFPFNAKGAVITDCDLCRWHLCSQLAK